MRQTIRFELNHPVTVALESPEGVRVAGHYGPQVKFFLTEERVMYAVPDLADAIRILGVKPGEPFAITKRWESDSGKKPWWDLERVKASKAICLADNLQTSPSPVEIQPANPQPSKQPISAPEVPRKPARAVGLEAPPARGGTLTKTPPFKATYEQAFRECLRIVCAGLADAGESWSDHSVQAMTSTLFIQAARDGRIHFSLNHLDEKVA